MKALITYTTTKRQYPDLKPIEYEIENIQDLKDIYETEQINPEKDSLIVTFGDFGNGIDVSIEVYNGYRE